MGLPPRTQPAGSTTPTTADDGFRPIPLSSAPILGGGAQGGASGVTFKGNSLDAIIDDSLSCCGKYHLRNTNHRGVAGITSDGCTIFAINCQLGGRFHTAMGAFSPEGKPIPLTMTQKNLLGKYIPDTQNAMIPDAISPTVLGLKTSGHGPGFGAYIDGPKKELIFRANVAFEDDFLKLDASARFNRQFQHLGGTYGATVKSGAFEGSASTDVDEKFRSTSQAVKIGYKEGDFSAKAAFNRSGDKTTRKLEASYQATKYLTITASYLPDVKRPSGPPKIDFSKPPAFEDYSNFRLLFTVTLP